MGWDNLGPRRLFVDYLGCPEDEYHRETARLFLLGAVARAFCPGHKFDFVPILEGAQGAGKSTFIRILGLDWAGELAVDFHDNNKVIEAMQGLWIIEIAELQGFSKADTTTLKATVSRTHDKARLAWDRNPRDYPRQCVFIGSTNDDDYLRDPTGGRRFWPIRCKPTASTLIGCARRCFRSGPRRWPCSTPCGPSSPGATCRCSCATRGLWRLLGCCRIAVAPRRRRS